MVQECRAAGAMVSSVAKGMVVYSDDNHLTATYARRLLPKWPAASRPSWAWSEAQSIPAELAAAARPGDFIPPAPSHSTDFSNGSQWMTARPERGAHPQETYTILVVDDEEPVRRLAVRMLTWSGYQAVEASHAREAIVAMEQQGHAIHLVLTDIKMPGMSGRELGAQVAQRWPGKPVLYMSGFASEVFEGGLLEREAPFLAKPFTQEDLAAKIRSLLGGTG
jgi:CheY-like chemotaxis protein